MPTPAEDPLHAIDMPRTMSFLEVFLIGVVLYFVNRLLHSWRSRATPLPPGPMGWPVIGNLFQISSEKNWVDFATFGKKYGEISTITILGTRYVILNSINAISNVLEKQSVKCSDRPHLTMAADLVGLSKGILLLNYNDRFRQDRKFISRFFGNKNNMATCVSVEEEAMRLFLRKLVQKPDGLVDHIRCICGSIILKMIYGYTPQEDDDPFVELADKFMAAISHMVAPGAYLVDVIPALRYVPEWFPGTGFLQEAKEYRQMAMDAIQKPHQYVVDQIAAGTAIPSFTSVLMEGGVTPSEEDVITWAAMDLYLGGIDTSASAIHAFFNAMLLFPEVQAKAQKELDTVIGTERLPTYNDRDSLPYINALCKEVLRWHTVVPLAVPHVARENIFYDGYLIPKGTYIIGNSWAILNDETTYPDPAVFRPERFLGEMPEPNPQTVCFGFGRRACPGHHFAEAALFVMASITLAAINISEVVIDGVKDKPTYDVSSGAIARPKPFKCQITVRSAQAEALLNY